MKDIPNKLHCAYCIRNRSHGGECTAQRSAYDEQGCLIFKMDEKGCIRNSDIRIHFPLYCDIPLLNTWCDDWEYNGVETSIKINRIHGLSWNTKKGRLVIHCNCDYYVNEFSDCYKENNQKLAFKVVK